MVAGGAALVLVMAAAFEGQVTAEAEVKFMAKMRAVAGTEAGAGGRFEAFAQAELAIRDWHAGSRVIVPNAADNATAALLHRSKMRAYA